VRRSTPHFLRWQHVVFQQNWPRADFRCVLPHGREWAESGVCKVFGILTGVRDKTDLGFSTFANAALFCVCGTLIAAVRPMSSEQSSKTKGTTKLNPHFDGRVLEPSRRRQNQLCSFQLCWRSIFCAQSHALVAIQCKSPKLSLTAVMISVTCLLPIPSSCMLTQVALLLGCKFVIVL